MRLALALARRGWSKTSPNPLVGAVLARGGKIIGRGWHRRAGGPHAEIEAIRDAQRRGHNPRGATLYVTLEPCCTHGRTPPCTEAIVAARIRRVVVGAIDPNPNHARKSFAILQRARIAVSRLGENIAERKSGESHSVHAEDLAIRQLLADECVRLNEVFNHWIVHHTPFVTVKAAMTLDGKIASASGESKWITGEKARACGMKLRQNNDAILVGVNTVLADDPSLTFRTKKKSGQLRRIILDSLARTPLHAKVVTDEFAGLTTIVVSKLAPENRAQALARRVNVVVAPVVNAKLKMQTLKLDLRWLLKKLGSEDVTSLLVEGGGEVNASFLEGRLANRIVFFYAPKILGGRDARKAVAGTGARNLNEVIQLRELAWRQMGPDLMLTARVD
ncbi:MAG: bifunctional diaminohydroxyphosphoribosylaminopyrimidine deaminase/5-amino-6-(5-phosphoribosylamino)uracil reductase RibD [Verrucomicrobia bacterium]|nr:bifunctional diaminohydroxyphosphoribosylaminopyrimidine deaminase/5-amino-6-(5-phosphoribosylamino)uracil reductase RibD [Verrucomicrobiota bacterium]